MKHAGTCTLETGRLILRRFTPDDAQAMYEGWASDPEVTAYMTWPPHKSAEESAEILREWVAGYESPNFYNWAIVLRELGKPIGSIGAVGCNELTKSIHVGYCLGTRWWRQGIMPEALGAVIGFFFRVVGLERIEARHDPRNPNSGKVMRKCGMVYEGTHRKADRNNQGICDAVMYAILWEDYPG